MISRSLPGVTLLLLAACSSGTGPSMSVWEGTLQPVAPSTLTGVVAAVSQGGRTEVAIEIRQAVAGQAYGWRLDAGTCPAGGAILGGAALYPALTADAARTASGDAAIPGQLSRGARYAARVFRTDAAGDVLAACADLAETSSEGAG